MVQRKQTDNKLDVGKGPKIKKRESTVFDHTAVSLLNLPNYWS